MAKSIYYVFTKEAGLCDAKASLKENPIGAWKEDEQLEPYLERFDFYKYHQIKSDGYSPNELTIYASRETDRYVVDWYDHVNFRLIVLNTWPDLLAFYAFLHQHLDLVES